MRGFVAGETGAIGNVLVPRLVGRGHDVLASTRTPDKGTAIAAMGATPVVLDLLDAGAVGEAIARAEPDAIVHQATALSGANDLRHFDRWFAMTNRLRTDGTDHLLSAARAAGVRRFVAQSDTGWDDARTGPSTDLQSEADPLDPDPLPAQRESMAAIVHLERAVTSAADGLDGLDGIVLRYGNFYGPGASDALVELVRKRRMPVIGSGAGVWSWIHIDDAAEATVGAVEGGDPGIYNVVDDDPAPVAVWLPALADAVGAKPPMRVPKWVGRLAAG